MRGIGHAALIVIIAALLVQTGSAGFGQERASAPAPYLRDLADASALAFDRNGALFVASASPSGRIVHVLQKDHSLPFTQTNGRPVALAFDAHTDLYIADPGRKAILKAKPWGAVSVVADGLGSPSGIAIGPSGDIYAADADRGNVLRITLAGRKAVLVNGLRHPTAIAVAADAPYILVADGDRKIWRMDAEGKNRTLFASLNDEGAVAGMTLDEKGNVYLARDGGGKVSELNAEGKTIATYPIPGPRVVGVALGGLELKSLFVTEAQTGAIYRIPVSDRSQRLVWEPSQAVRFTDPPDGAILNRHDGEVTTDGLRIKVTGVSKPGGSVNVNGAAVAVRNGRFETSVVLRQLENKVTVEGPGGERNAITVLWDRDSFPRYRMSVDDNIWFLRDIARHADTYKSIFENPYLAFWRSLHEKYGTKVHFNIYYETEGFNLSQMPDKFRPEWQRNKDWMRLTFHARANDPDYIYIHATADQVRQDYRLVTHEIERFAGKELTSPITTLHWGVCPRAVAEGLHAEGVRGLVSTFWYHDDLPYTALYLPLAQWRYLAGVAVDGTNRPCTDSSRPSCYLLGGRDYFKDTSTDLLFVRMKMVVNTVPVDEIPHYLDKVASDPHQSEVMELVIHEQYFYPDFEAYEPDYRARVERAIQWMTQHGYKSVLYDEGFLGAVAKK